jgi:hypothetical protein
MWYNTGVVNRKSDHGATGIARGLSPERELLMNPNDTLGAPAFKTCVDCEQSLPVALFSKNRNGKDGLNSYCKPCASARYKLWLERNRARRQEYMRDWHQANLEHETRYARERYRNDEEHRRQVREWDKAYRERNAVEVRRRHWERKKAKGFRNDQTRAHTAVNRAVRRGILPPAWSVVCDACQEAQAQHWHHHNGYEREHWLDVVARCLDCHGLEHRGANV